LELQAFARETYQQFGNGRVTHQATITTQNQGPAGALVFIGDNFSPTVQSWTLLALAMPETKTLATKNRLADSLRFPGSASRPTLTRFD
jgi:hypothetical protein